MSGPILSVSGMTVRYGPIVGLRSVDLLVAPGEVVAIIGANGAGKSSLLNGIMRLAPASGEIRFDGDLVPRRRAHRLTRRGISLVPERRQVFPDLSVEENLLVGAQALRPRERRVALGEVYERFPLLRERCSQRAGTMSGGQQQILAIGRAIIIRPKLCLLDEPSLGLAPVFVDMVFAEIRKLSEEGMTMIIVEQLASAVLAIADRGYVLENGRIAIEGEAASLLGHPEVVRRYLGAIDEAVAAQ